MWNFEKIELERSVSIMKHDIMLFSMLFAENISNGLPKGKITQEGILSVSKASNAHDFIIYLP